MFLRARVSRSAPAQVEHAAAELRETAHDDHQQHRQVGGQVDRRQSVDCRHRVSLGPLADSTGMNRLPGRNRGLSHILSTD